MPSGFLNVYKPVGMSSHQVIQEIRRITGQRQVGHAGTLDPMAEGVLPVAIGSYTRLLEWTNLQPKVYQAEMSFGAQTHSGDRAGYRVAESGPPYPNRDQIEEAILWLQGEIRQFPPQVSALKQNGRRAYDAVRQGESVWLGPRPTVIDHIRVVDGNNCSWTLEFIVGPGTYIRAIVRDLGFLLGQAATMRSLIRTRVGHFTVERAYHLEQIKNDPDWSRALLTGTAMLTIPSVAVNSQQRRDLIHGKYSGIPHLEDFHGIMGLTYEGQVVAVIEGPPWRFRKVLAKDE
ncbi:tRNA pseudouridine55 synthase [Sulfobacillus thermosulfidooxidans DSM 9293]|uniref:tRNA pseudouridine synthase B n=2 Tax=Sulfobacillus thermosulfidooxidans TaxID=28034 RepID=A0A1W1WJX0_SULTA|nr:tRNA pseudouridine(55) synthase TruB [Sulfobacillus thermosulfidooxidans]PSR27673.1 MAG: tRNA pseudouridine(55) synthase TruB [Sulfobacillus thermosulfidooxidans]SMC06601.1 tRNA pseudouridine55 synthase [Sulfobacillus thermosulfidooxidans DSM 9293]